MNRANENKIIRKFDSRCKSAENSEQLAELGKQIEEEIENHRNSNWHEYLEMLGEVKNIYLKALNDPIPFAIFWGSFQRINSTLARKWLVSNINLVTLYSKCIELISHSDVQNFFENWNYFQGMMAIQSQKVRALDKQLSYFHH